MKETAQQKKFLLVSIIPQKMTDQEALKDLKELKSLIESYGGVLVDLVTQQREVHDKGMYIGSGKVTEVNGIVKREHIDVVVLNTIVKPGQLYEMKMAFYKNNADIEVWDRIDLILHIFSKHAHTAEAKLQIDLAVMRHMGPRIYGMGMVLSRQTGGIGTRGIGETNTELMKRHWRDQMKKAQAKLEKLTAEKQAQLKRREKLGLLTVSIVGYTNAGKTALFNLLTGKKKLSQDILFATLDSTIGKLYLPTIRKEVLISDTIGFIKNLPPNLIQAFKSTLIESINADLLIHVIDASDEDVTQKMSVVKATLRSLEIGHKKQIYVFNKMDRVNSSKKQEFKSLYANFPVQFVSVKTENGIHDLLQTIGDELGYIVQA